MTAWKRWFRLSRIVPSLTLILGIVAGVLALLNLFPYEQTNGLILVMLGLLAVDALIERTGLLERLEIKLNDLNVNEGLLSREALPKLNESAKDAKEICILAISAYMLLSTYQSFFEQKIRTGCKVRILLVDPTASNAIAEQAKLETPGVDIPSTMATSQNVWSTLQSIRKDKCEVRLMKTVLPYSMIMVDPKESTGYITVEFHSYEIHQTSRPNVMLKASESRTWFEYFRAQYEEAWKNTV